MFLTALFLCISYIAVFHSVKYVCDFLGRFLVQLAYDINRCEGEDEARDDFIKTEPCELLPDKYCEAADYYTGDNSAGCGASPEECHQKRRAEGCSEACPGVCDNIQNEILRVHGKYYRDEGDAENGKTSNPDKLIRRGVFADCGVVKVLRF